MKTVIVTGFGPYLEEAQNPSGAIAQHINETEKDGVRIHGLVLPVSAGSVHQLLEEAVETLRPDVLLITGVTPGRAAVAAERIAINVKDFPIPDVDGREFVDEAIIGDGPAAYFSTLPVKAILKAWRDQGIPSYVSNSAGTYLCNQTFYLARHIAASRALRAGLVHIPLSSTNAAASLVPTPSLAFETMYNAVLTAALISANHDGPDLKLGGGMTC
jgi:pyroglutamyl-peptidase